MTTDILLREDTGSFAPVRVIDPDQPVSAPYSRAVGILEGWVRDERHAVDEFAAWIEGQAAQAAAEMRALCDELELPVVWAVLPDVQPASLNPAERDATLDAMVRLNRRGWTPPPRIEDFGPAADETMPGRPVDDPMYARAFVPLPHKKPTKNRLAKRRFKRGLRRFDDNGPYNPVARRVDGWLERADTRLRQTRFGRWLRERFTPVKEEQ